MDRLVSGVGKSNEAAAPASHAAQTPTLLQRIINFVKRIVGWQGQDYNELVSVENSNGTVTITITITGSPVSGWQGVVEFLRTTFFEYICDADFLLFMAGYVWRTASWIGGKHVNQVVAATALEGCSVFGGILLKVVASHHHTIAVGVAVIVVMAFAATGSTGIQTLRGMWTTTGDALGETRDTATGKETDAIVGEVISTQVHQVERAMQGGDTEVDLW